jgi:DnaJ family protein C protein 9
VDDAGFDWTEYYRTQFAEVVTNERIEEIKREYQGSDEEKQDVLKAYTKYKGDLDKLLETVLLSDVLDDEARFKKLIETAIEVEAGEVQAWDKFTKETDKTREKRRKRALKERREAERFAGCSSDNEPPEKSARIAKAKANGKANDATKPRQKAKGKSKPNSMNDLAALIQQRQAGRTATTNAFFDSLEEKYGGSAKGSKGKKRAADEPPEEAFAEMGKRAQKGA